MYSLHRDGLKALWSVVARVVDESTHRVCRQFLTWIGTQETIESFYVLEGRVKPLVVGCRGENDRHSIMDRGHEVIRLCGDDRTGFDRFPIGWLPVLP